MLLLKLWAPTWAAASHFIVALSNSLVSGLLSVKVGVGLKALPYIWAEERGAVLLVLLAGVVNGGVEISLFSVMVACPSVSVSSVSVVVHLVSPTGGLNTRSEQRLLYNCAATKPLTLTSRL